MTTEPPFDAHVRSRPSDRRAGQIAERASDVAGIVIANATVQGFPITYVSPGFERLTGYLAAEVTGRSCRLLQGPDTDLDAIEHLRTGLAGGHETYATLLNYRADGTTFWNEVALAPQHDQAGTVVQFIGVQRDVTARRRLYDRYRDLAFVDSLTGLANRAALHDELDAAIHRAGSSGEQLSLFFIDIDDFKRVNDEHGHVAGDALLTQVGARLRAAVRPEDLVARPGGDEFLMLIRDVSDAVRVQELASRVIESLRAPFELEDLPPIAVRASLGVSSYPEHADSADTLLRRADAAMYSAKDAGRQAPGEKI